MGLLQSTHQSTSPQTSNTSNVSQASTPSVNASSAASTTPSRVVCPPGCKSVEGFDGIRIGCCNNFLLMIIILMIAYLIYTHK